MIKKLIVIILISIAWCSVACAQHASNKVIMDASTGVQTTIDYEHHEVHAGSHFFYTDSASLNDGLSTSYVIQTPNTTKWAHMTFAATGNAITTVDLYESIDLTGVGARQTIPNSNRNSASTSGLEIWDAIAPGAPGGTLIWTMKSGSATAQSRAGITTDHSNEIILKQNTRYMIRVTSGTANNLTNLQLEWYEHTDKRKP